MKLPTREQLSAAELERIRVNNSVIVAQIALGLR